MPNLTATDAVERRRQAEAWLDTFEENNRKYLKTTIATWNGSDPDISYEDVDTSLIPPRPRLYGLVGAEVIMDVFKQRQQQSQPASGDGNGSSKSAAAPMAAAKS
jgi:succinate dehydrogenase / fumarate reductase flavoprotein subunit